MRKQLVRDLATVINKHNVESISDTPDWILAEYLVTCLDNYHSIDTAKKSYYSPDGVDESIVF